MTGHLLEPGTWVRTHGRGLIGVVMPYEMAYCQDGTFPVLLGTIGVTRQMACDELDVLPGIRSRRTDERDTA